MVVHIRIRRCTYKTNEFILQLSIISEPCVAIQNKTCRWYKALTPKATVPKKFPRRNAIHASLTNLDCFAGEWSICLGMSLILLHESSELLDTMPPVTEVPFLLTSV